MGPSLAGDPRKLASFMLRGGLVLAFGCAGTPAEAPLARHASAGFSELQEGSGRVTPSAPRAQATPVATQPNTVTAVEVPQNAADASHAELHPEETAFFAAWSAARQGAGLQPVMALPKLLRIARNYSCRMAKEKHVGHVAKDGSTFDERLCAGGFNAACAPNRGSQAENLAAGQPSGAAVHQAWQLSPSHEANLSAPHFRYAGIGYCAAPGSQYGYYWTLLLSSTQ